MAESEHTVVNLDDLDLEDRKEWMKEMIENGSAKLREASFADKVAQLINNLHAAKIISGFNKKSLENLEGKSFVTEFEKVILGKGWDNFKRARDILYDLIPELVGVWDERTVDLPVLSIKYQKEAPSYFFKSEDAENDGNLSNTEQYAEEDGLFTSRAKHPHPNKDMSQPVSRDEVSALPAYSLTKRKYKGLCLIINNENYHKSRANGIEFKDRRGSSRDANALKSLYSKLGFYVEAHGDLTRPKLDRLLAMLVRYEGMADFNCFVCVFLSHGENELINCTDGNDMMVEDILAVFKGDICPALNGIPKWFIFQACRGKEFNIEVEKDGPEDNYAELQSNKPIRLPACADFYLSYATAPGYYSYRNTVKGSWFIQCLVEVLEQFHWCEDVNTMMTRVNRKVALGYHHKLDGVHVRQMPCHVNMLTGSLYLHPVHTV